MDTFEELGYAVIPFPYHILLQMKDYILDYIVDHGRHIVFPEVYEEAFNKGARIFPVNIGNNTAIAMKGNRYIKDLLKYNEIDLNRLCQYELDRNPALKKDQYHVYWRFVRPHMDDIGKPHRDSQFYEIDKDREVGIKNAKSWKLWVPIAGCTMQNALRLVPGSHKMVVPTFNIDTVNGPKPSIASDWLERQNFICPFPDFNLPRAVLFHENVVHMGPYNVEDSFRISTEITIYVN